MQQRPFVTFSSESEGTLIWELPEGFLDDGLANALHLNDGEGLSLLNVWMEGHFKSYIRALHTILKLPEVKLGTEEVSLGTLDAESQFVEYADEALLYCVNSLAWYVSTMRWAGAPQMFSQEGIYRYLGYIARLRYDDEFRRSKEELPCDDDCGCRKYGTPKNT